MKHIDLIVDALEYCDAGVLAVQKIEEALIAAREFTRYGAHSLDIQWEDTGS